MVERLPLVVVTDATGFIGSHVVKLFLEHGGFCVRGTVGRYASESKVGPLLTVFADYLESGCLELKEADLMDQEALAAVFEGATYVAHVACPLMLGHSDSVEFYLKPAVEGTISILRGAQAAKVKRVCITSSLAVVMYTQHDATPTEFTDEDWSDHEKPGGMRPYERAKTYAEKAAWDFLASLPEEEKFGLTMILPGLTLGPPLTPTEFVTGEFFKMFLLGKLPGGDAPRMQLPIVDVREVAQAYVEALLREEAQGKRFIICSRSLRMGEFGRIVDKHFRPFGYNSHSRQVSYCLARMMSYFNGDAKKAVAHWGKPQDCDSKLSREVLGLQYRPVEETIRECGIAMIELGTLPDKRGRKTTRCCGK